MSSVGGSNTLDTAYHSEDGCQSDNSEVEFRVVCGCHLEVVDHPRSSYTKLALLQRAGASQPSYVWHYSWSTHGPEGCRAVLEFEEWVLQFSADKQTRGFRTTYMVQK